MGFEDFKPIAKQEKVEKVIGGAESDKQEKVKLLAVIESAKPGDYIENFNFNNLATEASDSLRQGNIEVAKSILNILKKAQEASIDGVKIAVPDGANLEYLEKDIAQKESQN